MWQSGAVNHISHLLTRSRTCDDSQPISPCVESLTRDGVAGYSRVRTAQLTYQLVLLVRYLASSQTARVVLHPPPPLHSRRSHAECAHSEHAGISTDRISCMPPAGLLLSAPRAGDICL